LIAGVRCPRSDGNEAGEEFGEEAKSFVEFRLLQRTVHVELLGLTPQSQLIGIISHGRGNIAEHLLLEGLARCDDFHSTLLGARMARLRAAEKRAKEERLRMWKGHVVKKLDNTNSFDAVVSRIIWADQLIIRNKAGQEKKISLSSVRGPKYVPVMSLFGIYKWQHYKDGILMIFWQEYGPQAITVAGRGKGVP